jgi:hypothetical protein
MTKIKAHLVLREVSAKDLKNYQGTRLIRENGLVNVGQVQSSSVYYSLVNKEEETLYTSIRKGFYEIWACVMTHGSDPEYYLLNAGDYEEAFQFMKPSNTSFQKFVKKGMMSREIKLYVDSNGIANIKFRKTVANPTKNISDPSIVSLPKRRVSFDILGDDGI